MPLLKPLQLNDRSLVEEYFRGYRRPISDSGFASLFMWAEVYDMRWMEHSGCLCLFAMGGGEPSLFFPPLGNGNFTDTLTACRAILNDAGAAKLAIEFIQQEDLAKLPAGQLKPRSGDYVYDTKTLIDLPGGALASKRQSKNAFLRRYQGIRTETYEASKHLNLCLELMDRWKTQAETTEETTGKRGQEAQAAARLLEHSAELGCTGMMLYAEDQVAGFTIGEPLGKDSFVSVIEKTDRAYSGSAQYIWSEFCRAYWADTPWCNACDDWDVPSLAWTKESYRPAYRIPKWRYED